MTTKSHLLAAALAASSMVVALPHAAFAEIITATFTGTVQSGTDGANFFGGGDLTGDAFTSVYTFDTSIDVAGDNPAYAPGEGRVGSGFLTGESLTINGLTHSEVLTSDNEVVYDPFGFASISYFAAGPGGATLLNNSLAYGAFHSFTDVGSGTSGNGDGHFAFGGGDLTTSGRFTTATVNLAGPGGIPEPATWGLMILGFGFAGAALRRRSGQSDFHPLAKAAD